MSEDYEIYKYIDEQVDQYIDFSDILKQNKLTLEEAGERLRQFKDKYFSLLEKHSIKGENIFETCDKLIECVRSDPDDPELRYLYFCMATDFGLLNVKNSSDTTEEQEIRKYLNQREKIYELEEFFQLHLKNNKKFTELKEYLKNPIKTKNIDCTEESDLLYRLSIQHTFLYDSIKNNIYKDNLQSLLIYINGDEKLKAVKPYIIFAVVSRKTGMMQKREHFMPNLKSVFQYQDYNISNDNGKNFNHYQSELEFYDHLRRTYADESFIDMDLCDFCFANLSPLSEWYYIICEVNAYIPMNLKRKIISVMPDFFPLTMSFDEYNSLSDEQLESVSELEAKMKEDILRTADVFLNINNKLI